ncbi:MAG: hypothetical protein ThorAB25_16110 [Candidatus Thorarchaeota archaeon AB_25]|nr:MAG: hypothetical protein ThorAB25_16110 [Candidatus Thorarchaeota archaeon AB_25]
MDSFIRKLREDDTPELIEIAKTTWEGRDHLPQMLEHWLSDSNCFPFVMEIDSKVVSVATLKIMDQGTTGWMEGLRVHPEFRERGFAAQMTNHLLHIATKNKLDKIRLVTAKETPAPQKLAEFVGMNVIGQYSVFWKGYRRNFRWIHETDSVERMEKSEVIDFVQNHTGIFPNRVLIHHWYVFDPIPQNLDIIAETSTEFWFGDGSSASFSSGFQHETRYGSQWCFTIYASTPDGFLSNLSTHLHHARMKNIRNLMCIHPPEFQELYSQVKWLKRRNHGIQLLLFERVL